MMEDEADVMPPKFPGKLTMTMTMSGPEAEQLLDRIRRGQIPSIMHSGNRYRFLGHEVIEELGESQLVPSETKPPPQLRFHFVTAQEGSDD